MKGVWNRLTNWVRKWVTLPGRLRACRERMFADEYWRGRFKGWTVRFGVEGRLDMESACLIAQRCDGAEYALKRLADAEEKALAEAGIPGLTRADIERLAVLAEECGEVAKAVSKVLRHGYKGASPFGGPNHKVTLEREMGNVRAAIDMMITAGDVRGGDVQHWRCSKRANGWKYMHHQG